MGYLRDVQRHGVDLDRQHRSSEAVEMLGLRWPRVARAMSEILLSEAGLHAAIEAFIDAESPNLRVVVPQVLQAYLEAVRKESLQTAASAIQRLRDEVDRTHYGFADQAVSWVRFYLGAVCRNKPTTQATDAERTAEIRDALVNATVEWVGLRETANLALVRSVLAGSKSVFEARAAQDAEYAQIRKLIMLVRLLNATGDAPETGA